jgi:glyoxylase-like metal-dependent hydrolase (beta-lactamase superfamily II)
MEIQKFNDFFLDSNSYLLCDEGEAVLIDCGSFMEDIYHYIHTKNVKLKAIILTHAHLDHAFFANDATNQTGAPIYCHTDEIMVLNDDDANASKLFHLKLNTDFEPKLLNEGDKITVGNSTLEVLHTPGHTIGSICLLDTKNGVLFTGDTMFKEGYGRTDFKFGNRAEMINSLKRLLVLDKNLVVYSGHGDETTIENERKTYNFEC